MFYENALQFISLFFLAAHQLSCLLPVHVVQICDENFDSKFLVSATLRGCESLRFLRSNNPVDLKTRKSSGTICQIEIHFSSQASKFLMKYNLLRFQISDGLIIFFTEHDYKVSTSFIKENKRYISD